MGGLLREVAESERDLWRRLKEAGETEARDALVARYRPLVLACVREMRVSAEEAGDVLGDGWVGLLAAIDRFDPAGAVHFITYAHAYILGEMRRGRKRASGLSFKVADHHRYIRRAVAELTPALGRTPTPEEIASRVGLSVHTVGAVQLAMQRRMLSLDDVAWEGGQTRIHEVVAAEEAADAAAAAEARAERHRWKRALARLTQPQKRLLRTVFWRGASAREAATLLGLPVRTAERELRAALVTVGTALRGDGAVRPEAVTLPVHAGRISRTEGRLRKGLPQQHPKLWRRVRKTRGCWVWTGGVDSKTGTPICYYGGGSKRSVARLVYELTHEVTLPRETLVVQSCGNQRCLRPDHLTTTPRAAWNRKIGRRGRHSLAHRRATHRFAKLTDAQAADIRTRIAAGESQRALAREYGVSPQTVTKIKQGRAYAHAFRAAPPPPPPPSAEPAPKRVRRAAPAREVRGPLSRETVRAVVAAVLAGDGLREVAERHALSVSVVFSIRAGQSYRAWVSAEEVARMRATKSRTHNANRRALTEAQVADIRRRVAAGEGLYRIAVSGDYPGHWRTILRAVQREAEGFLVPERSEG